MQRSSYCTPCYSSSAFQLFLVEDKYFWRYVINIQSATFKILFERQSKNIKNLAKKYKCSFREGLLDTLSHIFFDLIGYVMNLIRTIFIFQCYMTCNLSHNSIQKLDMPIVHGQYKHLFAFIHFKRWYSKFSLMRHSGDQLKMFVVLEIHCRWNAVQELLGIV